MSRIGCAAAPFNEPDPHTIIGRTTQVFGQTAVVRERTLGGEVIETVNNDVSNALVVDKFRNVALAQYVQQIEFLQRAEQAVSRQVAAMRNLNELGSSSI